MEDAVGIDALLTIAFPRLDHGKPCVKRGASVGILN